MMEIVLFSLLQYEKFEDLLLFLVQVASMQLSIMNNFYKNERITALSSMEHILAQHQDDFNQLEILHSLKV